MGFTLWLCQNGHWNSWFSHEKYGGSFHSYGDTFTRGVRAFWVTIVKPSIGFLDLKPSISLLELAWPYPVHMATQWMWQTESDGTLMARFIPNGEILQIFCRFWCASCGHVFVQAKWRTACVKFLQWRFWQGEGWKSIDEAHSMTWAGSWPSTPCYAGHRPLVSHTWHVHAT